MKKKNLKKLSLNKDAVSNLEQLKGGVGAPASPGGPVAVGCSRPNQCSVKRTCSISFYASDCWLF